MADSILLEMGVQYRARLILEDPVGAATPAMVASALEGIGFTLVEAWLDPAQLPADWPKAKRSDEADLMQVTAWTQGVWSKANTQLHTPAGTSQWQLYDLWNAKEDVYQNEDTSTSPYVVAGLLLGGLALGAFLIGSKR